MIELLPEDCCDCVGNHLDCNGLCGGPCEYDECGVCCGSGLPV